MRANVRQSREGDDARIRVLLAVLAVGLLVSGVVAAFVEGDGVTTAALMAAGVALLLVSYLGRYVTHIRFREFEADLASLQQKVSATASALEHLETVARRYEAIRAGARPGSARDRAMEDELARAAAAPKPERSELLKRFDAPGSGGRIVVLGAMKAHPDLRDPEIVLAAIEHFRHPFDHDRFLVLAAEMLGEFDEEQQRRLRELIDLQRSTGVIEPHHVRWATSERLIRLMTRE